MLEPLRFGKSTAWRTFDWATGEGLSSATLHREPKPVIVLDGAYSTRLELHDIIDVSILIDVPNDAERRARLVSREGADYMNDWHASWDVAEGLYLSAKRL